jgi:hypothetical protein
MRLAWRIANSNFARRSDAERFGNNPVRVRISKRARIL